MARDAIALEIDDVSAFARTLRRALADSPAVPGHLAFLNQIARAAGYQNFQHLRAGHALQEAPEPEPVNERRLTQVLRCYDARGRLMRWPGKTSQQALAMWVIWSHLPARREMTEPEVNAVMEEWHGFGDRALLRRSLIDHGLASRSDDCRSYRRIEAEPPAEARALMRRLSGRDRTR